MSATVDRPPSLASISSSPRTWLALDLGRTLIDNYRWALMAIPLYVFAAGGISGWPLALGLGAAVVGYNRMYSLAELSWPTWTKCHALYLRCIEIGFACIGLSLLYIHNGELTDYFYYDGFYALFVALAGVSFGRSGVFWSACVATLAVGVGQVMLAPDVPVIFTGAGLEYWAAAALYAATFGLFFLAIGLLAYLATSLRTQTAATRSFVGLGRDPSDRRRIMAIAAHQERLATMGEVTAQVIHELSSPLTSIMNVVEYLQKTLGDRERDSLLLIHRETERAASMVRELLDYTRRGAAEPVVSLNDVVQRAIDLCQFRYRSEPIEIVRELSPEGPRLVGGPNRLQQVVLNLLENAQHALADSEAGRITIRTRVDGDRITLEMSDNGSGIPADVRERIFEPFFTTKEPGVGTGLGLAIVARIVRDCGGVIEVFSNGAGTTFRLTFPRAD